MKNTLIIMTALIGLMFGPLQAQNVHYCGTSIEDQKAIKADFIEHRDEIMSNSFRSGAVSYIPIKFHLIGNNNAEGQVQVSKVYDLFCILNRDYEPYDIQFYLQGGIIGGIKYINDTRISDDPSSPISENILSTTQQANRNAINIFVNKVVRKNESGVLGQFFRDGDYIVIANSEVIGAKSSLSHEIGHFFGLSHTFYGWESTEYECNQPTPTTVYLGPFPVPVEYVDRSRNCFQAADGLCDTPADYNLGLGYQGPCDFIGCAKDPSGAKVIPSTENMMGYFLSCISVFSGQQVTVMVANYNSNNRSYLRTGYTPSLTDITEAPELLEPSNGAVTSYFDQVDLEWQPVAGAEGYIVSVDRAPNFSTGFFEGITTETEITISDLSPGVRYYWKVQPISEYKNCAPASSRNQFTTSSVMTSTRDDLPGVSLLTISPNPGLSGNTTTLSIESSRTFNAEISVININGSEVSRRNVSVQTGINRVDLSEDLPKGTYLVRVTDGQDHSRFLKWCIVD